MERDGSSARETRILDKNLQVEQCEKVESSKHQETEVICRETEKQEPSGETVTSPIKRKSQLKDDEAKRKRIESLECRETDDENTTNISDPKASPLIKACSEKSKATLKSAVEVSDSMKKEKVTSPSEQLSIHKDLTESPEKTYSATHAIRVSVIQTVKSYANTSTPVESKSKIKVEDEIKQRLKINIEKKENAGEAISVIQTASSYANTSTPTASKSKIKVEDEIKQRLKTNIEQKENADEAISDISKVLHTVLKVEDSKKGEEISDCNRALSDNVKEKIAKVQKQTDKPNIDEESKSKNKTDPAAVPITILKPPSMTEIFPQIEGLAARMMLNVKVSALQNKGLTSDDTVHSKSSQYKKRRSEVSNTSYNSPAEISNTVMREATDLQHSLSKEFIFQDKRGLPEKLELYSPDKRKQNIESPMKVMSLEPSSNVSLQEYRSKTDSNESEKRRAISKICEPLPSEEVLPQFKDIEVSANPRGLARHKRASSASSFNTQSSLLHPIYVQPESRYVPIERYHKDIEFVETQKLILASLKEQTKATKYHSDPSMNRENEAQKVVEIGNLTVSPSKMGQIVKPDKFLPVDLSVSSLSPNKNICASETERIEFRQYPGLADEPAKVKKDARYQKKFYKQKPVILPVNWKADIIPSDEPEQNKSIEDSTQHHSDQNINLRNEAQKVIENRKRTINPTGQIVESGPLLPVEDRSVSNLSPNKSKLTSETECAEFRKYPGLADEPAKVKKDARYQKKFYKQNPVILPVNLKATVISSGEPKENIDLKENRSEDIDSASEILGKDNDDRAQEKIKSHEDEPLSFPKFSEDCKNEERSQLDNLPETPCAVLPKTLVTESKTSTDSCKSIQATSAKKDFP